MTVKRKLINAQINEKKNINLIYCSVYRLYDEIKLKQSEEHGSPAFVNYHDNDVCKFGIND